MLLITYDISDDKLRTRFAKYLSKYGHRLQYSVFEIDNSQRFLNTLSYDLKNKFEKEFSETDSVLVIKLNPNCDIKRYGYAKNENNTLIIV